MFKPYLFCGLLVVASTSHSGTMGCQTEGVTVPCDSRAWDVGISALYLKPTSSLLNPYLRSGTITIANGTHYHSIESPWDWGFILEGSYHFNTGNDINLNWLHFNDSYGEVVNAYFPEAPIPISLTTHLNFETKLDVVNFEFAQNAHLGSKTNSRVHAGLQYANATIDRNGQRFEQITDGTPYLSQVSSVDAKYNGLGPRLGGELSHQLSHGFSVFAKGAMALLVGEAKTTLAGTNLSGPRITPFVRYISQTTLVPELETKLGASYQFNGSLGQFSLLAGWMFQHYFEMFLLVPGERINEASSPTNHELSLNGPFLQGKWVSNA